MDLEAMQERINEAKARQHVIEHGYERTYFLPLLPTLTLDDEIAEARRITEFISTCPHAE
jgi:hypothetical protein